MATPPLPRPPHWYGIPVRVGVVTFIGTLLCFAVSLLLSILGTVILAAQRHVHPDMRIAYRQIALPMALVAGAIIFVLSLTMEIRHYRQSKTLSAIERMGWRMPRIAIPIPHSNDREYGERAIPQYERAVRLAGGTPVRIPLDQSAAAVKQLIAGCDGVLLPGSKADVDPARFKQNRSQHTAAADARREDVDFLLLDDAYAQRKPVLGICYGLQSLNVYRAGSLIQHIPDFLPEATRTKVNHEAGSKVAIAHAVEIAGDSRLAQMVNDFRENSHAASAARNQERLGLSRADDASQRDRALAPDGNGLVLPVNSSHHQSADRVGDTLRLVARCPEDGIIEAIEGTSPDHFVLAVQWHPERSVDEDDASRNIFRALIEAAGKRQRG